MELCVVWQDIRDTPADVVILKVLDVGTGRSARFMGAASAVVKTLSAAGATTVPMVRADLDGQGYATVLTAGAMAARQVRFSLTGPPPFQYAAVFRFAQRLTSAVAPRHRHLATTLHGPGLGLSERAALEVQVDGLLSGLSAAQIDRVSIVEHDHDRAMRLRGWLLERFDDAPRVPDGVRLTEPARGVRHPREWAGDLRLDIDDLRFFSSRL